jgi:hypothetical protein
MVFAQSKNKVILAVIRRRHINIIMILGGLWKTLQANRLDTDLKTVSPNRAQNAKSSFSLFFVPQPQLNANAHVHSPAYLGYYGMELGGYWGWEVEKEVGKRMGMGR